MSFEKIKGQPMAVKLLQRAVTNNRIAGAYLFYGPRGIGKRLAAIEFAKGINCGNKPGDSCDRCSSCIRIEQNNYPDVLWVYPAGKSRQIKIERVRELQKSISWRAYEGRKKVAVIVDAHTLKIEAGNALLKTLEEPPPNSVIILITHSPETLLPTIRSRTQGVQFFHIPRQVIAGILESDLGFNGKDAELYSQLAMGSPGRALNFKDEDILEQRRLVLDMLAGDGCGSMKVLLDKIKEIQNMLDRFKNKLKAKLQQEKAAGPADVGLVSRGLEGDEDAFIAGEYRMKVESILDLILSWYRDILIYKNTGSREGIINGDYQGRVETWADKLEIEPLFGKIAVVEEAREIISRQVNLKLVFQVMFLRLGLVGMENQ